MIGVDPGNIQFDTVLMGRSTYQPALDITLADTHTYPNGVMLLTYRLPSQE